MTTHPEVWRDLDALIRTWWDADLDRMTETELRLPEPVVYGRMAKVPRHEFLFLPFPYVRAGGSESFSEFNCWDTHFINLALLAHDRADLVRNNIRNQLYLIERFGVVLNGNRRCYLTRSQTPLLAESVRRYYDHTRDRDLLCQAFPLLKKEYRGYWQAEHHQTPTGLATNRHVGPGATLRPELAAECESTDFSACFDGDVRQCNPILTNCALVQFAKHLAWMATELGWPSEAGEWRAEAEQRAARIRALCWDETLGFFFDYHHVRGRRQPYWSLCGYWALWAGIATPAQARRVAANLAKFEHAHGLAQTAERYPSPHPEFQWVQWGYPAGWPPMHIQTVASLDAYGFHGDAARVAAKYLRLYLDGYRRTGKLWEKFNVVDGNLEFPTERYEVQPMHGWASAVVVLLGRRVFGASG